MQNNEIKSMEAIPSPEEQFGGICHPNSLITSDDVTDISLYIQVKSFSNLPGYLRISTGRFAERVILYRQSRNE